MSLLRFWRKFLPEPTLAERLGRGLGKKVKVEFSEGGAQRIFSSPLEDGSLKVTLDPLFEKIEGDELKYLIKYLGEGDEASKEEVISYLKKNSVGSLPSTPEGLLQKRLNELISKHFAELPPLRLVLGRLGKRGVQKSIRLASFWAGKGEVRVHPHMLDDEVPDYYITFLLYHELCHAQLMLSGQAKSGEHHGPDFYALEDQCPDVEKSREWEKEYLSSFLISKIEHS